MDSPFITLTVHGSRLLFHTQGEPTPIVAPLMLKVPTVTVNREEGRRP